MLKTSHSVDCFKQAVNRSELIREQKKDILPSSSQQVPIDLGLPEGFRTGKAIGEGDCFFDAVAQGLNQLKPGGTFTVKSLRNICRLFAEKQLGLDSSWLTKALKNERKEISYYSKRIEFTADDIKKGSKVINALKLTGPIWGLPEIEGRIICIVYNVRLHFVETTLNGDEEVVITHHLIDEKGYQKNILNSEILSKEIYRTEDTIHIVNQGDLHFRAILRGTVQQTPLYYYKTMASEKKLDSESVYFRQNFEAEMKDVTDNQMDCEDYKESSLGVEVLPDESTIGAVVDYEDRLSDEELQESPRVVSSSSTSKNISDSVQYSALTHCKSTVEDIGLTDDEIVKRATFFVKTFVEEFEKKLLQYSEEAKPGSKIKKTGKTVDQSASIVNNFIPPNLYRLGFSKSFEVIGSFLAAKHRKRAKKVSMTVVPFKSGIIEILVEAGLEIFQSFETQFTKIVDTDQLSWERGIQKLAIDAVHRVMNYISVSNETGETSIACLTQGIILGKSKRSIKHSGYRIKDKQDGKILITSELYRGVGIVKIDSDTTKYYQSRGYNCAEKYGYRLPFAWELEKWWEVNKKYMLVNPPEKGEYVRILDEEKKKELVSNILREINGNNPAKRKDIEELCKKIENLQTKKEESIFPFLFNLGYLPTFFIKREMKLEELKKKLGSKNQEVKMSRMVLITGEYGTGKSELARSYGYDKENGTWRNIIWIDAKTPSALLSSFRDLAKELGIPTKNHMDLNVVRDRGIESIVKDVYKYVRDVKSLFIFDNASNYEEIEKFLPSHFSDLFFGKEKPYVLITSRNKNWEEEIEKIELDNGFSLGETITFIERTLEIKDRSQNRYLVGLAEALNYLPLALTQATAYIKQGKINVSEYLKLYNKEMQKPNPNCFEALGLTKELFITLTLSLDKIKRKENVGQQSNDIVAYMAYLNSNPINIVEIFLQKKSEKDQQKVLDALHLLDKFSVIELEESIARVHMGVQKTIRLEKEQAGTEEEILREIMTSFCLINANHAISVWSHASKYDRLVNEFIDSLYDGDTILHLLAKGGNEEVIKRILKKVDPNKLSKIVNAIDKMKFTPLDCAAMHGHLEIVKYFIEKGSDLNGDNRDLTPLHWAALSGQLEVVKHFIDNKYWEVDKLSGEGGTPLHYGIISGNIDVVKYLVEEGADVDLQDESAGPLHFSVQEGRLDIVEYLVEEGRADINLCDKNGMSPLYFATQNGRLDIVIYLVERGANVNLQDKDYMSPFCHADESVRLNIAKYLIKKKLFIMNANPYDKNYMSSVCNPAMHDHLDSVKYLIMQRTIVDPLNKGSISLLHFAAVRGYLNVIDYLVGEGANVNEKDKDGMSPLHFAVIYGHSGIIDYLVGKGANVNLQNKKGVSPLHLAVIYAHLDSVKYLVEKGADIHLKDKGGMSPLFYALTITINRPDIARYVIEYSSLLTQRINVKYKLRDFLHERQKRRSEHLNEPKKRKLENISATFEENASNTQLLQGRNLPSDISMQFEGLADRTESMVSVTNETPMFLFDSVAVEPLNNKNLRR